MFLFLYIFHGEFIININNVLSLKCERKQKIILNMHLCNKYFILEDFHFGTSQFQFISHDNKI